MIASPAAPEEPRRGAPGRGRRGRGRARASRRERVTAGLAELGRREHHERSCSRAGPTLAGSFLDAGEIDELRLFIAPIVVGGMLARPSIAGNGATMLPDATAAPGDGAGSARATTCWSARA